MKGLSKENCGKELSLDEVKGRLVEMLDEFTAFCDANGIRYFLSGGTLLGAIRHKGFIPWDDDVDVNIPRPDIERLYELSSGRIGSMDFLPPEVMLYDSNHQFYKLFNKKYIIEDTRGDALKDHPIYYPLNIDVFPIDGFPESEKETRRFCRKLVFLRNMLGIAFYDKPIGRTPLRKLAHALVFIPVKLVGYDNWCRMYQKCAKKYDFDKSKYVGATTLTIHILAEKVEKESYIKPVEVEFEGRKYHAPSSYDIYLRQLYNDYMQLPPEEKRVSDHKIKVYENVDPQ